MISSLGEMNGDKESIDACYYTTKDHTMFILIYDSIKGDKVKIRSTTPCL